MAVTLSPPSLPSSANFLLDVSFALAIGLAAVWLLSNRLRQSRRLLTFLCVVAALAGFGALTLVLSQDWNQFTPDTLSAGIVLAVGALVTSLALTLDGLICRGRYRPVGLYLWLFLMVTVLWLVIAAPFFIIALIASGGRIPWSEFFIPVLWVALGNCALLLPFLLLSSASPFFRDRLKALLHVKPEMPPSFIQAGLKPGTQSTT